MATTTLVCKQCNFENEPERVYCHNCGAKLDRSLLPPEATKREDPVIVQERVRKMVNPRRGAGLRWFRHLFFSLTIAAVLAAVIVLFKPPGDAPDISKDAVLDAPNITDDMEGLAGQPGRRLAYPEDKVNAFIQGTFHGKRDDSGAFNPLKFERAYVRFDEGDVQITYVQSVFGLSLYATTTRTVQIRDGKVEATPVAGSIGRMPLSPRILPYVDGIFSPLWRVMERERALVAKMGAVNFHKQTVEIVSKPAGGQ